MTPGNMFATQKSVLMARIANSASWFIWIAGISLINSVFAMTGSSHHFILGLGLTQLIDFIPKSTTGHAIAFGCDLLVAMTWVLFQWQGKQGKRWPFIVGVIFLVMDTLLLLVFQEWFSAAFHVYAVMQVFVGIRAASELSQVNTAERQQAELNSAQVGYAPAPGGVWPPPPGAAPAPGSWPPAQPVGAYLGEQPPSDNPGAYPGGPPDGSREAYPGGAPASNPGAYPGGAPASNLGAYLGGPPPAVAPGAPLNDPPPPEKRY